MRIFKVLCLCAVATGWWACSRNAGADDSLKVISYNIRHSKADDGENSWPYRKGATLELLVREAPDLVGMQEVLAEQYDFIAAANADGYGMAGIGRDDGDRDGEMMAVMHNKVRLDKLDEGHFWLSETPGQVSRGWDGRCNRMVTWLKLKDKITGKELYFFNTHLDHQGPVARRDGSNLLGAEIIKITDGAPFILSGDFNAPPDDEVLAGISHNFPSAREKAPATDNKATFNGFGHSSGSQVIDHIYYRGLKPSVYRTLDGDYGAPYISDHYPIEAVFTYAD